MRGQPSPPLTTIQIDHYIVDKVAAEEMVKIIEAGWQKQEPTKPKSIMLTPTLVVRQSLMRVKIRGKGGDNRI
jgi:DNA-binding LacI/PurR family transcriptional regulator